MYQKNSTVFIGVFNQGPCQPSESLVVLRRWPLVETGVQSGDVLRYWILWYLLQQEAFVSRSDWHHTPTYYSTLPCVPPRGLTSPLQKCPIPQPHDRGPQTLPLENSFFAHLSPQMWSTYCFSADTFLLYYISGGNESFTSAPEGSTFSSSESWVMSTGSSLAGKKPNFCFSFN